MLGDSDIGEGKGDECQHRAAKNTSGCRFHVLPGLGWLIRVVGRSGIPNLFSLTGRRLARLSRKPDRFLNFRRIGPFFWTALT
jgi:hypothetical protein